MGHAQERIAAVVGCDAKTLHKHFAPELAIGSAKLEAQLAQNLLRIAQGSDRPRADCDDLCAEGALWLGRSARPVARALLPGKKERAQLVAERAGENSRWDDLLKVRPPPSQYRPGYTPPDAASLPPRADEDNSNGGWGDLLEPEATN